MKKLIIHIGTHKTGTSSFQRYCYKFKEMLDREGICYPSIKGYEEINNHSILAWALDRTSQEAAISMLNSIFSQFNKEKHHTLLISSEDLENSLLGSCQLHTIIAAAKKSNFESFEILVVTRDPFDYLSSIYAELSKQNIVINFPQIAAATLSYGFFSVSTQHFNYGFAINSKCFVRKLSKKLPEASINHYNFKDFTTEFPGHSFLTRIAGEETTKIMKNIGLNKQFNNIQINPLQTEINYAQNMFNGLEDVDLKDSKYSEMIMLLAKKRLAITEAAKEKVAAQMKNLA